MEKTRLEPVVDDIKKRFAGREIGLRGVLGIVGADSQKVVYGEKTINVAKLETIIESGTEHIGDDKVLVAPVSDLNTLQKLPERVEQYLCGSVSLSLGRTNENSKLRDNLVPVVLVYDMSKLRSVSGYEHSLPTDPIKERSKVIIGAYPIDVRNLLPMVE